MFKKIESEICNIMSNESIALLKNLKIEENKNKLKIKKAVEEREALKLKISEVAIDHD